MALAWAVCGSAIAVAPSFMLVTLFDLPEPPGFGYGGVAGVLSFSLALLMVMMGVRGRRGRDGARRSRHSAARAARGRLAPPVVAVRLDEHGLHRGPARRARGGR